MIKKFEQFVNEIHSSHKEQNHETKDRELLSYLYSIGVDREATTQILKKSQEVDFYYTPEEAENIFERIPYCDNAYKKAYAVVNVFFTVDIEFDDYCKEHNIPIVRGVNGKLLTGKVVYSEYFNQYGENEDDIIYMLDVAAEKEGLTPEEYTEQNRGQNILDGVEVDLDKEYGYKGDSSVKESINYDQLNESFTNQELKDAIKAHGGLADKYFYDDARTSLADFDLKNAKFVGYLKPETVNDIYNNNCYILLYKSRDIILRTNDGGIIIVEKGDGVLDKNYDVWVRKVKTRNNNWIEDIVRKHPEEEYWNSSKRDIKYDSIKPEKHATYMRRKKHINRK